jgi:hypothetical protein
VACRGKGLLGKPEGQRSIPRSRQSVKIIFKLSLKMGLEVGIN